jgi:hypothetical protein
MVKKRLTAMLRMIARKVWDERKAFYFKGPSVLRYGTEQDVIYGVTKTQYFQVLDEKLTADEFIELRDD